MCRYGARVQLIRPSHRSSPVTSARYYSSSSATWNNCRIHCEYRLTVGTAVAVTETQTLQQWPLHDRKTCPPDTFSAPRVMSAGLSVIIFFCWWVAAWMKSCCWTSQEKIFLGCWNRETWQLHLCRLTSLLKSLYFRRFCSTKISEKSPPGALPPADNFPAKIRPGRGIRRPIKNQFVSKYLHNNAILRYFGETYLVLVSLRRSMMLQQRLEFAENGKKSNRCGQ